MVGNVSMVRGVVTVGSQARVYCICGEVFNTTNPGGYPSGN